MRLTLVSLGAVVAVLAGCPQPPHHDVLDDAGTVTLPDAGPPPPPTDGGVDDAGFAIPADAGPVNSTVRVLDVTPPTGPLSGLDADGTQHRVIIKGDGFTNSARVFFDDVEADTFNLVRAPDIIAVHPSCASAGPKTVTVYDELGVGQLAAGYTCFSPIEIDSIDADHGSCDGGEPVTITGKGFHARNDALDPPDTGMLVTLGGRQVVDLVVVDDEHATFITPPLGEPGRKDAGAADEFGRALLPLAFTCTAGLRVDAVTPDIVDDTNAVVELDGTGFAGDDGDVAATIGGAVAARDNLISDSRLRVIVPSGLAAGAQDVVASRVDGAGNTETATCAQCLVVRPATTGALTITAAVPNQADTAGGTVVTLVGEQFTGITGVTIGGSAATSFAVVDDRTITLVAPAGPVGTAPIVVTTATASATLDNFAWFAPVVVGDVAPSAGPQTGGTTVAVTGRGFVDPVTVTFGGVAATDCVVDSPTEITCTTAAGAAGPVDVVVTSNGERGTLHDGYRYDAALTVVGIHPSRGGYNGLTFVTIVGSGFTKATPQVWFNKQDPPGPDPQGVTQGLQVAVVDDSTLTCLTPPTGQLGLVDVTVTAATETATAVNAFTYFNPTPAGGGASGGPIDGAIYVSALDATSGLPVPGMYAWIGTGDQPVAGGITDLAGIATISGPLVSGPQTVNVAGECFSSASFVDVNASELTAFVFPLCPSPPRPPPPPPPPIPPAIVRGHVFGFAKEFFDPAAIDQSGCTKAAPFKCEVAVAEVATTTPDEFTGNPPLLTDSVQDVFEEGGDYFLDGTRTGQLAIIAIAGIFDTNNETFSFKQLGIRRAVFPQHGVELDNQDVELTIPLDSSIEVSLPDAPLRADSDVVDVGFVPTVTRVVPALQLGGEGAFVYTQQVAGSQTLTLRAMPEVPGSLLTFVAGAYTTDGRNQITNTGAVKLTHGDTLVTNPATTTWSTVDPATNAPQISGKVFVTDDPATGARFASIVQGCEHPIAQTPNGPAPDFTTCGDGDGDGETWLELEDAWPFASSTSAQPYHIGDPDGRFGAFSQVVQDGIGDVTRGGVTVQPVLGLQELVSPLEAGALIQRTLRWRAAPGQQPSLHDMFLLDAFGFTTAWEIFADGSRTKVIVPDVPQLDAIEASLPPVEAACVANPKPEACALFFPDPGFRNGDTVYVPPSDMVTGGIEWQHEQIFAPTMDGFDNWSFIDISSRGQRSLTRTVHFFVHGDDR